MFSPLTPCLVAYAIDQDPYFRLCRDIAERLKLVKPASIMTKFLIPLSGNNGGKMSSSNKKDLPIFLTDNLEEITLKVSHAFSGSNGDGSLEDHAKLGGNLETDVSY
jgi:tryptophanyl-tRNA synthetase